MVWSRLPFSWVYCNFALQLEILNLNSNRLFSLENLNALTTKAPNIKSLSLKDNEVCLIYRVQIKKELLLGVEDLWNDFWILVKLSQIKSDRDLDVLKKLPIQELHLEGNQLCDRFDDERAYVR